MNRYIYAIYPFISKTQEHSNSVYVGITYNVEQRIKQHYYDKYGNPDLYHAMQNGFAYQILDEINEKDSYLEYDYIDLFEKTSKLTMLNRRFGNKADFHRAFMRMLNRMDFWQL